MLKPFATVDDQKIWRERFSNLLTQREQAHSDPDKKEPPCMACYTKIPSLASEVMAVKDEALICGDVRRLTPSEATWMSMFAFCKRCCSYKSQLTGGHLSCIGMRSRAFQLLEFPQ